MGVLNLLDSNAFKMWKRRQAAIERIKAERMAEGVDEVNAEYQAHFLFYKAERPDSGEE